MKSKHAAQHSRRSFLKTVATTATAAVTARMASAAPAPKPPNVVMLISDDQDFGDYSFVGHPHIKTPNIDRLATQSRCFTRGYVTAPLCCPSLASMVTGLHPHQHKITSNDPPQVPGGDPWPEERLAMRRHVISHIEEVPTLPNLLKQKGFTGLQTGKWWMGHYTRGGFTHGMTHGDPMRGGRHGDEGLKIGREGMQPIYDYIESNGDAPFFVWYAPFLPHSPHTPPQRLLDKYRDKTDSIHIARYWAMCEWWDETCGELMDYLKEKGLDDNTIVLYVCDNGWTQRPDSPRYDERSKRTPYEGGVRTPIMVRWPGHVEPHMDTTTPVSSIDLATTILDACGLSPTEAMQGVSLLDYDRVKQREAVFGAAYWHDAIDLDDPKQNLKNLWCVTREWKLIVPAGPNAPEGEVELFHIAEDPRETKNLAATHPDKVDAMLQRIQTWWPEGAATIQQKA